MYNKDTGFKINITVTVTVTPDTPAAASVARTPVRVSPMDIPRTPVADSDAVVSIGFQRLPYGGTQRGTLVVEWVSGGVYVYEGVPHWMYDELMMAKSKGGYMNRKVKPIYTGRLLVD